MPKTEKDVQKDIDQDLPQTRATDLSTKGEIPDDVAKETLI